MKSDQERLFLKVIEKSKRINNSLSPYAEPRTVSYKAKIPFKALSLRELLIHRMADLSEVACDLLVEEKFLSSIIIARSLYETTTVAFILDKKMKECLEKNRIEGFDDTIIRLLVGSRTEMTEVESMNILTLIDHWSKDVEEIKKIYDDLCEFTHPNYSGCMGCFGKFDKKRLVLDLGKYLYGSDYPISLALIAMNTALDYFIDIYDGMASYLPQFSKLCEESLDKDR